jgi:[CysO sulfur-carrier protein]-S-L-cysteine hydrolase
MEVRISSALAEEMVAHLDAERPNEGCGLLGARDGEVVKVFKMTNASASPVRYSLDPKQQFAVYQKLEEEGWELGGVYHSHTHTEAYPSPTDVRLAAEDVPYVIVSLAEDPPSIRAFRIVKENFFDETGEVEEVPVTVTG